MRPARERAVRAGGPTGRAAPGAGTQPRRGCGVGSGAETCGRLRGSGGSAGTRAVSRGMPSPCLAEARASAAVAWRGLRLPARPAEREEPRGGGLAAAARPDSPAAGTWDPESSWGACGTKARLVQGLRGGQPRELRIVLVGRRLEGEDNLLKEKQAPRFARFEKEGCPRKAVAPSFLCWVVP